MHQNEYADLLACKASVHLHVAETYWLLAAGTQQDRQDPSQSSPLLKLRLDTLLTSQSGCGLWCLAQWSMSGQAKFGLKDLLLEDIGARQRILVRLQVFLQGYIHLDLEMHMQSVLLDCVLARQMSKTTLQCRIQGP